MLKISTNPSFSGAQICQAVYKYHFVYRFFDIFASKPCTKNYSCKSSVAARKDSDNQPSRSLDAAQVMKSYNMRDGAFTHQMLVTITL